MPTHKDKANILTEINKNRVQKRTRKSSEEQENIIPASTANLLIKLSQKPSQKRARKFSDAPKKSASSLETVHTAGALVNLSQEPVSKQVQIFSENKENSTLNALSQATAYALMQLNQESGQARIPTPVQKSVHTPIQIPVQAAVQTPAKEPVKKIVKAPVQKSVQRPAENKESIPSTLLFDDIEQTIFRKKPLETKGLEDAEDKQCYQFLLRRGFKESHLNLITKADPTWESLRSLFHHVDELAWLGYEVNAMVDIAAHIGGKDNIEAVIDLDDTYILISRKNCS